MSSACNDSRNCDILLLGAPSDAGTAVSRVTGLPWYSCVPPKRLLEVLNVSMGAESVAWLPCTCSHGL